MAHNPLVGQANTLVHSLVLLCGSRNTRSYASRQCLQLKRVFWCAALHMQAVM